MSRRLGDIRVLSRKGKAGFEKCGYLSVPEAKIPNSCPKNPLSLGAPSDPRYIGFKYTLTCPMATIRYSAWPQKATVIKLNEVVKMRARCA